MLTGRQNAIYRPLVEKAWGVHCARECINIHVKAVRNAWYRKALVREFGVYTTNEIRQDEQTFDRLCLYFATLANDQESIDYWSRADERRAMWRLEQTMQNARVNWPYVLGIARQMGFIPPESITIQDLPAALILKLNTAVFLHNRRQSAKSADHSVICNLKSKIPDDPALSFP